MILKSEILSILYDILYFWHKSNDKRRSVVFHLQYTGSTPRKPSLYKAKSRVKQCVMQDVKNKFPSGERFFARSYLAVLHSLRAS